MRDCLIEKICDEMSKNKKIFFLSADFGALALDRLRTKFKDRFINVGIAEQNLINISTGLAMEGFIVFAYGISAFISMRCYEQLRINLSLFSQFRNINVNLIGVGSGLSYDISGPSHHCLEDISIIRTLPNFILFSPSDYILTEKFTKFAISVKKPKYMRLDGKPLPQIYNSIRSINLENGFYELIEGEKVCMVSTGFMTHKALKVANKLKNKISVGVIDVFLLKPINEDLLLDSLKKYRYIITIEEAFINKGGLDSIISNLLVSKAHNIRLQRIGFNDTHIFTVGNREYLHRLHGLDEENIIAVIEENS
jgi:transketolase